MLFLTCFAFNMRQFLFITIWLIALRSYQAEHVSVTHEDIRDVILTMIRVMASTESKLHRHEMRERIFSDHLRKSLATLDKRLDKMDQKISKLLSAGDESKDVAVKINDSLNKIPVAINDLKTDIFNLNAQITPEYAERNSSITRPKSMENEDSSEEHDDASSAEKIQSLTTQMGSLQNDLSEMKGVQIKSYEIIEKVQMNLKDKDQLFQDILNKMDGFNLEVPAQDAAVPNEWQIEVIEALERQENFVERTLAQVKNMRNESLHEIKFLEESIKDMTNQSSLLLENVMKDLVKIQDPRVAEITNLTWKVDILNLVMEDVRRTVSEVTDQKENFELYLNDSMKNLEKICNNQNPTNTILESLNEVKMLEGSIKEVTDHSKILLENVLKDFVKIKDSRAVDITNLTSKMDVLNLVMEDLRDTVSDKTKTNQNENFELYLNDSMKNIEKICNNQNFNNKILEDLNEVKNIKDMTNHSKILLENIVKDFIKLQGSRVEDMGNLTWKMDVLNLVVEELRETISDTLQTDQKENFESYFNQVCSKQDATKILEALKEQSVTIFEDLADIKTTLDDSTAVSSENNSTDRILHLLENLTSNVENNTYSSSELYDRVENILRNEDQMLKFNRKSSQDIIDMIETLMINVEMNCNNNL